MKTFLPLAFACLVFIVLPSCESNNETLPANKLSPEDLTGCPDETKRCDYFYTDTAALDADQRIFSLTRFMELSCGDGYDVYEKVSIIAPMDGNHFELSDRQIRGGAVKYDVMCPCCNSILLHPAGGSVKGEKAENDKWLIEAKILLSDEESEVIDTLQFKQYFVQDPVD